MSRLAGRSPRRPLLAVLTLALAIVVPAAVPVGSASAATSAPGTPTGAAVVASRDSTNLVVSWTPATGATATFFAVVAYASNDTKVGQADCGPGCTSMVVPGLTPGQRYAFLVYAANAAGGSAPAATNWVTVNSGCSASSYCITADATATKGPLGHAASGLLKGTSGLSPSAVAPLGVKAWRVAITPTANGLDYSEYDAARQAGASNVTVVISDAWFWASNGGCGAPSTSCGATPPWQELSTYSRWVSAYVRQIEATGRRPDLWDVQNEPDAAVTAGQYYSTSGASTVTPANVLAQFQTAYAAVRAADPNAKVEGPSLSLFLTTPVGQKLDLATFIAYSAAHNLRWNAISWHENGAYQSAAAWNQLATVQIPEDVAYAKSLLAANPGIGTPVIALNEYGTQAYDTVPGWDVAELASIEASGVASANRTCYSTQTDPADASGCTASPTTLDELLTSSRGTSADFQVMAAYARLAGQRITTTPSDESFSAVGAIDGSQTVRLLVGRSLTCTAAVNPDCNQPASWTPAPTDVPVTVRVPWTGNASVTVTEIPDAPGQVVSAPTPVSSSTVAVTAGAVSLTLPQVADGQAWTVTVRPS